MTDQDDKQPPSVSISNSFAPVVGDYAHVEHHFHLYDGTWTDGVAPDPLVSKSGMITSPYRGLNAFGERDEALFFGRDSAATDVLKLLSRRLAGTGLVVVSGVSGAGKSSLLHAGVLPRLREEGLEPAPQAASWPRLVLTPGSQPLEALATRIAGPAGAVASAILPELTANPASFALIARQAAAGHPNNPGQDSGWPDGTGQRRVLLVVDQFEQLFTQCKSEYERQAFITALHAAASPGGERQHPAAVVVIGVRSDFEARLADYPLLAPAVQDRYLLIGMTDRQLRMAITHPAAAAGSSVDDDLVHVLLAEMGARSGSSADGPSRTAIGAGMLPLLSHALDQAWRGRTGRTLTLADYERTGGIEGAVASSAQGAYDKLTPAQQATAQQVFIRLTATSSDGVDTAARATRADLTAGKNDAQTRDVVEGVLEQFAAERLLTLGADSVEISHEVLLTAWPLLRDEWLAQTHADRIVRTRLHNVAAEWAARSRDPSYLYSGSLRQAAAETAVRMSAAPARYTPLSQTERDFLGASNRAHQGQTRRRRTVVAGLLALTLTALTAAVGAVHYAANANQQAANASHQHAIALSRQLVTDSISLGPADPVTARQLALAAWHVYPTDQAMTAMTTLLVEQQQNGDIPVNTSQMVFSPDGKVLASADRDGYVRLWDPVTSRPVGKPLPAGRGPHSGAAGVAFSPDGKLLASAGGDGYVRLWNPATGSLVGKPLPAGRGQDGGATGVAFSPNGKLLASAGGDGYVRLWNPKTGSLVGRPLRAGPSWSSVTGVAFSPDGKLLASAGEDGYVRLWNPTTGRRVGDPLAADVGAQSVVTAVAFSPDGKLLASAGDHGEVRLWDPVTGKPVGEPLLAVSAQHGTVLGVAFSPDGKLLASAGSDGYVRLWDPATAAQVGRPMRADLGQGAGVAGVAFSPDGKLLASAGSDGYMRLWDPATGMQLGKAQRADRGPSAGVMGVAFRPDGKLLASAGIDGYVRLWDPATDNQVGKPMAVGPNPNGGVNGLSFSPDGKLLASAEGDGYIRLWSPATGRRASRSLLADSDPGHDVGVLGVAFSPDGKLLASAGSDGYVRLWNPATGRQVGKPLAAVLGDGNGVAGVAFSPDGKLLASAGSDEFVRLWNPATGVQVGRPLLAARGQNASVTGVAFSPDGKLLASAGSDGYVRLWNPATGVQVGKSLAADLNQDGGVITAAFSPDGKLLASASTDGYVRLWNPATGRQVGPALPAANGQNIGATMVAFSPDGSALVEADNRGGMQTWQMWLNVDPYEALCTDVGPPTRDEWKHYAPGEHQPNICSYLT